MSKLWHDLPVYFEEMPIRRFESRTSNPSTLTLHLRRFTVLCLIATLVGCGEGRPHRVPVSGRVTIDGKPLTHGIVRFVPQNDRPSGGVLDSEGRFTLTCFDPGDGAVLGLHRVAVAGDERLNATRVRWHAPPKYASHIQSGLTQEITGPTDSVHIELTWDGGKEFVEIDEIAEADARQGNNSSK